MGVYSTVVATLVCSKCGREHECDVQFKTGDGDRRLPRFRELERTVGVLPGTYEGIADAYCAECTARWIADEKELGFGVLADAVSRGEVTVRRGRIVRDERHMPIPDADGDFRIELFEDHALSPTAIAEEGRTRDTRPGWPSFGARLHELDYVLFEGTERIHPTRVRTRTEWWSRHRSAVSRLLMDRGWPFGEMQWIDLPVVVTDDLVVRVQRAG